MKTETATLAGGCFWGMEDLVRKMPGVKSTRVGYSGGDVANAPYRNHGTHAEALEVVFDPSKLSFRELLEFFFQIHDPSTLNRQGNDAGTQYRSGIYYSTEEQKAVIDEFVRDAGQNKVFGKPIVTEVQPLAHYWPAEAYHQDYFENNPNQGYCAFVVGPKVDKFRKTFASRVKA